MLFGLERDVYVFDLNKLNELLHNFNVPNNYHTIITILI